MESPHSLTQVGPLILLALSFTRSHDASVTSQPLRWGPLPTWWSPHSWWDCGNLESTLVVLGATDRDLSKGSTHKRLHRRGISCTSGITFSKGLGQDNWYSDIIIWWWNLYLKFDQIRYITQHVQVLLFSFIWLSWLSLDMGHSIRLYEPVSSLGRQS